ncbi:MAG: chromosome segregation SMC family protein [Actinomycetota bacterium]
MYVKSLRLAGFKSFAEPTLLDFEGGVNVIVGPNGSGKSNIADALSWVLGSQAPSSLRGASMEDVIFAGSAGRSSLGMAEVALTLDNADRVLPLDLDEVTISRLTDRAGASEYRINGAPCRLLDVQELLSDTGIGRSIHTVVGQGQLDAVLHARPEDRRTFIEEAAQIGKFRRRKDRSLRKIERVDENLTRLNDVLLELRRSIRPLKRQASAAAAYTELMAEHRDLKQRLSAQEIRLLSSSDAQGDVEAETHRVSLLSDELSSVRARLEGAAEERTRLAEAADAARSEAHRIALAHDRLQGLARLAGERAATIAARLAAETEEGYRERIRLLEGDRDRWRGESSTLSDHASALRSKADAARIEAEDARIAAEDAERQLSSARAQETAAAEALVRAEGSEAAGRATIGSAEARVHAAIERRKVRETQLADASTTLQKTQEDVKTIEMELDRVTEAAAGAEAKLESAREHADKLRDRLSDSHAGTTAARGRLDALVEVRDLLSDIPAAAERVAPLVKDAAERARLALLTEDEARSILAAADEEVERDWGRVAQLDEELTRLDALMAGAAERLGGARREIETREVEIAALDDELARMREALAAAERAATEERALLPQRRADLDEARSVRGAAESRFTDLRERVARTVATMREFELEARGAEERSLAGQLRFEEAEGGIADAQAALAGLADLRSNLEESRARAEAVAEAATISATQAEAWAADAERRAVAARDAAHQGDQQFATLRNRERELSDKLEEESRRRNEAEVRRAEARARIESLVERAMEEWGLGLEAMIAIDAWDSPEESETAQKRVEDLDRQMRGIGVINPRAAEEYEELAERESFLVEQMGDLKTSRDDLMKVVDEVDATIVQVFSQAFEDVAREFEDVFQRLFPGGSGRLKLTDPDDVLHSGIDVEARPPGKNVKKLSLLSGGERSLVALCFLFAIFRSRPSPFYLLDEVEAALDDFNLQRFITLVDELEERAQVLVVTHQKRTMEAADVLYGVSMNQDGVSRVVAKRMEEATAEANEPA